MGRYLRSGSLCSVSASPPSGPQRCQTRVPRQEAPSRWSRLSVGRQQSDERTQPNTHCKVCVCSYMFHYQSEDILAGPHVKKLFEGAGECLKALTKIGGDGCVCVADRFELDSLSDLVQKCVPASAGHRPLLLLHLLQLGPLSDLAQQCRLPR